MRNRFILAGLAVSLVLAVFVSFYASSQPDGLEKVAEDIGFIETVEDHALADSPLADYGVSGVENARVSVGIAGAVGVVVTAVVAFGGFALLSRSRKGSGSSAERQPA